MNKLQFILCFLFFYSSFVSANEAEERQRRMERLQETMNMASEMLEQTNKKAKSSETELNLLNERISSHRALLNEMSGEFDQLSSYIKTLNEETERQEERLAVLKANYAKMLQYFSTQRRNSNKWLFVLSAENFAQSYRRFRYVQELTKSANDEMEQIKTLTAQLEMSRQEAIKAINSKKQLNKQQQEELRKLSAEQNKQLHVVRDLKKKEKQLLDVIRRRETLTEGLNKKIQDNTSTEARGGLTIQNEKELTENFEKSKGHLPMPVERGVISSHFGRQQHPVLKSVFTENKGINIQTTAGANALAVSDGVVSQRFAFPGYNNAVIVRHGNYRTVYSNLTDVFVKEGDIVSVGQALGKIFTDRVDGKTELFFLVYKEKVLQNPESFIKK